MATKTCWNERWLNLSPGNDMNIRYASLLALLSMSLCGCGTGPLFGVTVKAQKAVTSAPSRVEVITIVQDGGKPVDALSNSNFALYENGLQLDNHEVGLQIIPTDELAAGLTVLLLDLSGAPDATTLKRIERGATHFVEKVSVTQPIAVIAFDGSPRPREVARFSKVERATERAVPALQPFLSQDASRDLNGSMVSAIKGMHSELAKQEKVIQIGTIVTLLRGPDLAGRTTEKELRDAAYGSGFSYFSLSPEDQKISSLPTIGLNGRHHYSTIDTLPMRFSDLGLSVRAAYNSYYALSYCSPARSGERKLKVVVRYEGEKGHAKGGSGKTAFDSTGFTGGCRSHGAEAIVAPSSPIAPAQVEQEHKVATPKKIDSNAPSAVPVSQDEAVVGPPQGGKYE
jgi:hypothetical protein